MRPTQSTESMASLLWLLNLATYLTCPHVLTTPPRPAALSQLYAQVQKFSADLLANGGDFSLGFWVRAVGEESLVSNAVTETINGRFQTRPRPKVI